MSAWGVLCGREGELWGCSQVLSAIISALSSPPILPDELVLTFHSCFSLSLGELEKQLCHEYPNIIFSEVVCGAAPHCLGR